MYAKELIEMKIRQSGAARPANRYKSVDICPLIPPRYAASHTLKASPTKFKSFEI